MMLPPSLQGSLPAGWLAVTGRESNPLDHDGRFPSCYISSPLPGFILTLRHPKPVTKRDESARLIRPSSLVSCSIRSGHGAAPTGPPVLRGQAECQTARAAARFRIAVGNASKASPPSGAEEM